MLATIKAKNADSKHIQPEEVAARSQAYVVPAAPAVANRKQFPGQPEPAPNQPLLGSIDLSPEATSGEQFQTEISTTVSIDGEMFVVSSGGGSTLQVTNATDPGAITLKERVTLPGYASQSVASHGTLLAVALSPSDYANSGGRGVVRFYRVGSDGGLTFQRDVQVGYLPDSIAFNAQGTKLVIANEGEPIAGYATDRSKDPAGSIGIIDIKGRAGYERFSYTDLDFAGVTLPAGIRISGPAGTTQATDIEPEYVSILGHHAYVTLQENNGVAKVNLRTKTIEKIFALGTVDYRNQWVDLSDRDGPSGVPIFGPNWGSLLRACAWPMALARTG